MNAPAQALRSQALRRRLLELVAEAAGRATDAIPSDAPLRELGLDSTALVELCAALSTELGRAVPINALWEHPSVDALAEHLCPSRQADDDLPTSSARDEPIAIVGLACRLPGGADSPAALWRLLLDGVDATVDVPPGRWPADALAGAPDVVRAAAGLRGGFLRAPIDGFDAGFFGISPREAAELDPQQRLMLELSWEALEDAAIRPTTLRGSATAVYFGAVFNDYAALGVRRGLAGITAHTSTGQNLALVSNRVSYALGLAGPSVTVNTACSSALVAVHLACQALRAGEATMALAGGVHLMLAPETGVAVARFGALSPEGRCKSFDASADGYARGEGAGVVALRPLASALQRGERIYGLIRGSAVNNDGASNGLTAPNPAAQRAVIRSALRRASVDPTEVDFVETHGTGTALGDPIEARALAAEYGGARARPLLLGAIKTNLGHLEAAAGAAGLIKAALALHHGALPPNLHFEAENPAIPMAALGLEVPTRTRTLAGRPARAGVSSFGYGGTNAHLVLEAAPRPPLLVTLAGESDARVRGRAAALADALAAADGPARAEALCERARSAHARGSVRLAVSAADRRTLARGLTRHLAGERVDGLWRGRGDDVVRPVFVFAGLGPQWVGMARAQLSEPAFRSALERCDALLRARLSASLIELLFADDDRNPAAQRDGHARLDPLLVAVQIAQASLWTARGVTPGAVIGHSIGEIAAAHVAGALTLEDAMRVAASIGAVYQAAADEGSGRLAIAALSPSALASARVQLGLSGLHLAGYNSPSSTLICGPAAEVERLREELRARDTPCGLLGAVHSHCPAVEPFAAPLAEALAGLTPARARVPMWSTTTGRRVDGAELGASHWIANVRSPVRFVAAVTAAAAAGHRVFVELAPAVTLTPAIEQIVPEAQVVASQLRGEDGRAALASAHARLFALGAVAPPERAQARLYAVSARTDAALRARAADDAAWIEARGELELDALATSSLRGRALFKRRAAVIARSREELCEALTALAAGRDDPRRLDGAAPEHGAAPEVELVFTDVGAWARTVHTALEALPAFASTLLQARALTRTLLRAVGRDPERADAEPRLVTLHVALGLAAQWRAWGLAPIACRGVGVGALAAAHVRGDLTLKEALYAAVIGAPPPPSPTARAGALALRVGALDPATDEVACLRPDCAPDEALQRALAALLVRGVALDVDAIARDLGGATIDLPGYRFERQRCWMAEGDAAGVAAAGDRTNRRASPEPRPPTRAGSVRELVLAEVARVLELPAASLDDDTPLAARGLDSLLAVELTEALSEACGRELPAGLLYERPTVAALCQALAEHTTQGTGEPSPSLAAASDEPIAIVGAACRLPGGVASPDELWALLEGRVDAITEVPAERWPIDAYYDPDPDAPGKTYCRWGGFLTDIDRFDAGFFHVSAREAAAMDPQHRLLLEVCWEALEDAAIPIDRLRGAPAGVFVGISTADYSLRARAAVDAATEAYGGIGNLASVAAGRVAYTLGLAGPAMAVDTACSSSLLAVHLACQSLRAGECELALAGGVNLLLEPALTVSFSRLKVLARDGRCRAFDARASGYVRSEGCGVVALRRLSDARARGDRVLAVIRGSAVNHDGRSNGLTAPSGAAQVAVLREALARAGLKPAEVDCVEAHGTGTELGDAIELEAIGRVYGGERTTPLPVGSLKSNIGHTEAAAGIAGLLKIIVSMGRGVMPATLHVERPTPKVAWSELAIEPARARAWSPRAGRRRAGVSAFGIGGTNVHVIIEDADELRPPARAGLLPPILTLSARDPAALAELGRRYAAALDAGGEPRSLCFTSSAGRLHHPLRVAATGRSIAALRTACADPQTTTAARAPRIALWIPETLARDVVDGLAALGDELPVYAEALASRTQLRTRDVAPRVALVAQWLAWGLAPEWIIGDARALAACRERALAEPGPRTPAWIELDARASVYLQGQPAARALERLGCELVVDLGERPAVAGVALISACAGADGDVGLALAHALAQLYNRGVDLCWEQICAPLSPRRVRAPTYPFTRRRHWIDRPREPAASAVIDLLQQGDYATLARRIEAEGRLSPGERALLPGVLSALGAVMSGSSTTQEEASVSVQVHQPAKRRPPASPHPTHQPCLEGHEKKPAASRADAAARVRASLVSRVAELLGLDGPVDLERGLFDLGLDSLMISELHEHLRSDLGLEVPLTTFLERPTLTSLSEHLAGVLVGDDPPARPARAEPSEPAYDQLSEDEAIAVIARKYTTER